MRSTDPNFCRYCARLIYGWGGQHGQYSESVEESSALQEMKQLSMSQVRLRIEFLLSKGYDKRVPIRMHEQSMMAHGEASTKLIATLSSSEKISSAQFLVQSTIVNLRSIFNYLGEELIPYLSAVPLEGVKSGFDLKEEFGLLLKTLSDDSIYQENNDGDLGYCAYDSEEEARLFEELDHLLETQERAEMFNGNSLKFMANSFQKAFLKISELEFVFRKVFKSFISKTKLPYSWYLCIQVCDAFRTDFSASDRSGQKEPTIASQSQLLRGLELLSISEVNVYELQEIFEDGKSSYEAECQKVEGYDSINIPLRHFIAGSEKLRSYLLALPSDPIYCALVNTQLSLYVSDQLVKLLSQDARIYDVSHINKMIYSSVSGDNLWYVVLSGKLRVHVMAMSDDEDEKSFDLCQGEVFGGLAFYDGKSLADQPIFNVEIAEAAKFIEMRGDLVRQLTQDPKYQKEMQRLVSVLSGTHVWAFLDCLWISWRQIEF